MTESLIEALEKEMHSDGWVDPKMEIVWRDALIRAVELVRQHQKGSDKDFKYGRARPTLTSIMPCCRNGEKVVSAICEICGTMKGFTLGDNAGFPDSGYWTECRACQSWTMFYRLDGHGYIKRKHLGDA